MKLQVENLSYSINEHLIVDDVSFCINKGAFVGLVGPNGSGKSTLLKNIYRLYNPNKGDILLNNVSLHSMSYKQSAKVMSVLGQESSGAFDFLVKEMVFMGRSPHKKLLEPDSKADEEIVNNALQQVGMYDYKDRKFLTLSGGEKQRVLIARSLAQKARILILDEPTNHLDIYYKLQIMNLVKTLNITVFSAIHDLNIAAFYCDYLIIMKKGKVYNIGKTKDVLTQEMFKEVFNVNAVVKDNLETGYLDISYIP
ncbi:ABC transporter ATP-binding protein [Clostridium sp. 'deep sea']|uniref:ABC transporter ATP-binding protein n=1 Tax=Clostridium sp. 'deep sea' TaxID=2779445 RepID=UPI0018967E89|nr:ABC transporter ATP-binding protein [Clostridium sp. 'deep sea']QOR33964.1 ABC transporter ATP-binding protein [Clostridium sp. 'deep sea']